MLHAAFSKLTFALATFCTQYTYNSDATLSEDPCMSSPDNNQSGTSTSLIFRSDLQVAIIYSLYMLAGGVIFSQAFSLSADAFEHVAERAVSATVMSVVYYAGVVLCSMMLLAM